MVRNCQLSDLIYLTAPARAGLAKGVSTRERVGEPEWAQRAWALRALPGPGKVLPGLVGASPTQAPPPRCPTHLLPPPHAVTRFGFRDYRIREVTVIPYSRWLTTAKPSSRATALKILLSESPHVPVVGLSKGTAEMGCGEGGLATHP